MTNKTAALIAGLRAKAEVHRRIFRIETNETQILLISAADTITTLQADLARAEATIEAARQETYELFGDSWEDSTLGRELNDILAAYPTTNALNEVRAQVLLDEANQWGMAPSWVLNHLRARAAEYRNTKEAGK